MVTLAVFIGIWTTTCIQTQISGHRQGFAKEIYKIEKDGAFDFRREWYKTPACTELEAVDEEAGTIELGKKLSGFFITGETFEANYSTQGGVDLGAISLVDKSTLKISRGMRNSTLRNTMLSIFEYKKTSVAF